MQTSESQHKDTLLLRIVAELHRTVSKLIKAQIPLGSSHLDLTTTSLTCQAHAFWLCRASQTARLDPLDTARLTRSTCRARLARHDERDSQLSLMWNLYKVMTCKLFATLLKYTFILFHLTEQIRFVHVRE